MASGRSAEEGTEGGEGPPPPKNTGTKAPDEDDTQGEEATPTSKTTPPQEASKRTENGDKAAGKTPASTPFTASTSHRFPGSIRPPLPPSQDRVPELQESRAVNGVPKSAAAPPFHSAESKLTLPSGRAGFISSVKKWLFGEAGDDQPPQSQRPSVWMLRIARQHQRLKSHLRRALGIGTPAPLPQPTRLQPRGVGLQVAQQHPPTQSMSQQQLPTRLCYRGSLLGSFTYGPWASPPSLDAQLASSSTGERPPRTATGNRQHRDGDSNDDHNAEEEVKEGKLEEEVEEEEGEEEEEEDDADENDEECETEDDEYEFQSQADDVYEFNVELEDESEDDEPNSDELENQEPNDEMDDEQA